MRKSIIALFAVLLVLPLSAQAQTRDIAGSHDYPGIGRFGGSVITGYQVKDFDATRLQAARLQGRQAGRRAPARGPHHPHRLPHQPRAFDPGSVAQFRNATGQGGL